MSALVDVNGQVIEVGDWISYAAQRCDSSVLRFGRAVKVTDTYAHLVTADKYDDDKPSKARIYKTDISSMVVEKLLIPEPIRSTIEKAYNEFGNKAVPSPKKNVRSRKRKSVDC